MVMLVLTPWAVAAVMLLLPAFGWGAEEPLPQPLTLEHALSMAEAQQPELQRARAAITASRAEKRLAEARTGVDVTLEGRRRWIDPPDIAPDQSNEDHKTSLFVRKNLYDFGRSRAYRESAEEALQASRLHYASAVRERRVAIMEAFFDVLLADLAFARDNEEMAVVFVNLDRLRDRHELGQVSDIALFESEADFQEIRRRRAASEALQRATRARLAILLDRPGQLPSELAVPELPRLDRELPPYETLLEKALSDNPRIRALRARVEAANHRLAAARAGNRPYLDGELEASDYSREAGSHDEWRAGIVLTVPLYTGGSVDAQIGKARSEVDLAQAALREAENEVRQSVLETWLELQTLQVEADQVLALQDFRDLYLDRSRAIYELEVKTDLGDAMVRLSEAQLAAARNRFARALAWERLEALTDGLPANGSDGQG